MLSSFDVVKNGVFNLVFIGLLVVAMIPLTPYLRTLEGQFIPVVKDVEIEEIFESQDGQSVFVRFNFDKPRQCRYEAMDWYKRVGPFYERVAWYSSQRADDESDNSRPTGQNVTEYWRIEMSLDEFYNAFAEVTHACHLLWYTVTPFWGTKSPLPTSP